MTRKRNYLKRAWKNSCNQFKWIYVWRFLTIWNHCGVVSVGRAKNSDLIQEKTSSVARSPSNRLFLHSMLITTCPWLIRIPLVWIAQIQGFGKNPQISTKVSVLYEWVGILASWTYPELNMAGSAESSHIWLWICSTGPNSYSFLQNAVFSCCFVSK